MTLTAREAINMKKDTVTVVFTDGTSLVLDNVVNVETQDGMLAYVVRDENDNRWDYAFTLANIKYSQIADGDNS